VDYELRGLTIRAAGGLALFVITFFFSPKVEPLHLGDAQLSLAPLQVVELRALDRPKDLNDLRLEVPSVVTVGLRVTNDADQLGRPGNINRRWLTVLVGDKRYPFRWKYFVKHLSGVSMSDEAPSEARYLGADEDAAQMTVVPGGRESKEILYVPDQYDPKEPTWGYLLDALFASKLTSVEVFADTFPQGQLVAKCLLDTAETVTAVQNYIHANAKWGPSIGPSSTNGAVTPSYCSPHMKVAVFQWPCGTLSTSRLPCGALP
jgi:hypothetical protein